MILIKLGGSLIAQKNTNEMDVSYLERMRNFFLSYPNQTIMLFHGTGNVGHGFVKKYGLSKENMHMLRKDLDMYFNKIDEIFRDFRRISIEDIFSGDYSINTGEKIICGGDITGDAKIISSDDALSYILHQEENENAYILTDVDGVFDKDMNIIKNIDNTSFQKIAFWKKEGDVTGAMEQKIKKLFDYGKGRKREVWIINGKNEKNIHKIIEEGIGIGTKIYI